MIQPIERAEASEEIVNTVPELIDTRLVSGSIPSPLSSETLQTELVVEVPAVLDVPAPEASVVETLVEETVLPTATADTTASTSDEVSESTSASSTAEIAATSSIQLF